MKRLRVIDRSKSTEYAGLDFLEADSKAEFLQGVNEFIQEFSDDAKFVLVCDYDSTSLKVVSFRDETDAEMTRRLKRNKNRVFKQRTARQQAASEKKMEELRELRRLLAKYKPSVLLEDKSGESTNR